MLEKPERANSSVPCSHRMDRLIARCDPPALPLACLQQSLGCASRRHRRGPAISRSGQSCALCISATSKTSTYAFLDDHLVSVLVDAVDVDCTQRIAVLLAVIEVRPDLV